MENIEEIKKRIDDAKKQKDDATRKYYEAERKLDGIKSEIEYYQRMIKEAGQLIKTHTDHYDRVFEDRRRNIEANREKAIERKLKTASKFNINTNCKKDKCDDWDGKSSHCKCKRKYIKWVYDLDVDDVYPKVENAFYFNNC